MPKPRALILRTAGTNCDNETFFAFANAGALCQREHINHLIAHKNPFADVQILAIPGGFTYGDDVASGKILAIELLHALGEKLQKFVDHGGLVIGICNGFQVLVKTGLLPDAQLQPAEKRPATLTFNDSNKFECRWITLQAEKNTVCVFAEPNERIEIPVAHGEGKLVARNSQLLNEWETNGQIVYRYVTRNGEKPKYPEDPNGSTAHIAGLCDKSGRVFGLMPHPERHLFPYQHPRWTRDDNAANGAGAKVFARSVKYFS